MTLELNLLGEFSLLVDGKQKTLPKSKRTRALLAYLAMSARPKRRETLCEFLWDEHNDPKSALRWSLSKIRRFVNEPNLERLIADRKRVNLLFTNDVSIDVHSIKNKICDNKKSSISELRFALGRLQNTFLEGVEIPSQHNFQRWLTAERIEMERLYIEVLEKLWTHPDVSPEDKLNYMKIGLAKDPYNTKAAYALLGLLKHLGFASEEQKTRKQLQNRFEHAGVKWREETFIGNHVKHTGFSTLHDISQREIILRQQIRFCKTKDDTRIAYASIGKHYPIVKTANWLTHLEYDWNAPIWSPLFRELAKQHRIIRYDERGNGLSDWNVKDISFDAFVDDLETVVEQSELEKFALLGISQGASVSIQYAINHPDKVSHLILFGAYAAGWKIDATSEQISQREAIITLTKSGWGQDNPAYRQIFSSTFLPSASKEELDWFNEFQRQTTSPENAARFLSVFGDIDVRHLLSQIQVPTLVMHSLGDQRIPVDVAKEIAASIPNAEFVGLESDGHLLLGREAASSVFIETVKDFIARH